MSKKKYIISTILLLVVSITALIGTTYALFTKTLQGNKKVSVQAGTLTVDFKEGNIINLDNIAPMSDIKGQKTTPYTFSVENKGTIKAYYTVSFEEDGNNNLDTQFVKYRLTNDKGFDSGIVTVKEMGTGTFEVKEEEEIAVREKVNYTLHMWLSDAADNSAQGKTYKNKIVINSKSNEREKTGPVANVLLSDARNRINTTDSLQTFVTGENPNNYIWYSGKLWRAVSVDPADNSVKIVTQWPISAVPYNENENPVFSGSHMEMWLNDTSVDGFLANLRDAENFIKMDSKWNATMDDTEIGSITRPNDESGTVVTDAVGLLNMYEYQMSYSGTTYDKGYLNDGLYWWTITPNSAIYMRIVQPPGDAGIDTTAYTPDGIRPSVNLKAGVQIIGGSGTLDNPYRLAGDNDTPSAGTLLSTRYSGEYIRFGTGDNNLYRIVSKENGTGVKIVSSEPLRESGSFINKSYSTADSKVKFSGTDSSYPLAYFLNHDYLDPTKGYLTTDQVNMIENSTTWYLGAVGLGENYRLAKYTNTSMGSLATSVSAKVGILRLGELMSGQYDIEANNNTYWLLTPYSTTEVRLVMQYDYPLRTAPTESGGIRPSLNLKSGVKITGGSGTREDPFEISL